ncbi:MAG: hypothetical protein ACAF41_29165 [Leptolyngbya sp. BL-A-14]
MKPQVAQKTGQPLAENTLAFSLYPLAFPFSLVQTNSLKVFLLLVGLLLVAIEPALALPKPDDTPEEVLRTEIITGARSPIDGKPISASEYAQLQAQLQEPGPSRPVVGRSLEKNLNLLRLRKFLKTFFPFLPIP